MRSQRQRRESTGSGKRRREPSSFWRWLLLLVLLASVQAGLIVATPPAAAAGGVKMPFAAGAEWYVSQGYNTSPAEGWSHYNCDPRTGKDEISKTEQCEEGWQYKFSFDLRQVDGTEAQETALSPVNGTIRWVDPANGGVSIDMGNGHAAAIFHLDLARGLAEGQPVSQGQPLGRVAGPGGGNNGGTPHIHFNLWATSDGGNWDRHSTPFTGQFALDGYDFPDLGDRMQNQHWNAVVVSSNQQVGELPEPEGTPGATPSSTPGATPGATTGSEPGATPVASPPAVGGATMTVAAARVVAGTPLTINGAGFAPGEWVDLYWDSPRAMPLTEVTANEAGAWTTALLVPEATAGPHKILAVAETSGQRVRGAVEVVPALAREPVGGAVGSQIGLTLTGFAAAEQVDLRWGGDEGPVLASVTTNEVGSGAATVTIPEGSAGATDLIAFGQSSRGRALTTIQVDGGEAAPVATGGAILGPGTFQVTATVLGLAGGTTSSGHVIQPNDRLVALPACTTTSCPWLPAGVYDPLFGSRVECGELCYVRVANPASGQCAVAPVLETGPWFTLDDWWSPTESRMINAQPGLVQPLTQGYPAAAAAQDGLDVGFGRTPSGIGISNKGYEVGNRAAIDLASGTWQDIGFDPNSGIGEVVVTLLWLTGEDPATAAAACGTATPEAATPVEATPAASAQLAGYTSDAAGADGTVNGEAPATPVPSPEAATTPEPGTEAPPPADGAAEAPPPTDDTATEPPPAETPAPDTEPPPAEAEPEPAPDEEKGDRGEEAARKKAEKVRDRFGR